MPEESLTKQINQKYDPVQLADFLSKHTPIGTPEERQNEDKVFEKTTPFATGIETDKYTKYLGDTFNPFDPTIDQQRADSQGRLEQFGAFLNQAIVGEAIGGTLNAVGILADTFDGANYTDTTEKKWTNWFSEMGEDLRTWTKEATPVYQQHEGEFAPWSWSWWMANGPSVASTLSLMIPAALPIKGLSLAAKGLKVAEGIESGLTKAIQATSKLGKMDDAVAMEQSMVKAANKARRITDTMGKGMTALGQAGLSRHMENAMEASQSYDEVYNEYMSKHGDEPDAEETAKQAASIAASKTYQADWAMFAMDAIQYLAMPKFKTRGDASTKVINAAEKNALLTSEAANAMKMKVGRAALLEAAPEAAEEGWQFIAAEEAKYLGRRDAGMIEESEFSDRMGKYMKDGEFWSAAFMGAAGGAAFQAMAKPIQDKWFGGSDLADKQIKDLNQYSEKWSWLKEQYKNAETSGNPEDLVMAQDHFVKMFGGNAIKLGNTQFAINFLEGKLNEYNTMTDEKAEADGVDKKKMIEVTNSQINDIKDLENKTKNYIKDYGEIAPYIAEAELSIDKSDKNLARLEEEKLKILKEVGARRSMSSFAEESLALRHDNLGLVKALDTVKAMIGNNINKPEGQRLPESFFLKHRQLAMNLQDQLKSNADRLQEIENDPTYTKEEKRKDKAKGKNAANTRLIMNANRIGTNRVYSELYNIQKEQAEDTLNELKNPTKRKEIITNKMLEKVMSGIKTEEELIDFVQNVDLKKYHNTAISNATEKKLKNINDTKVTTFLAKENLTLQDFDNSPTGIMSKESADKLKAKREELSAIATAAKPKEEVKPEVKAEVKPTGEVVKQETKPLTATEATQGTLAGFTISETEPVAPVDTSVPTPEEPDFSDVPFPEAEPNAKPQTDFDLAEAFTDLSDLDPEEFGTDTSGEPIDIEEDGTIPDEPDVADDLDKAKKNEELLFGTPPTPGKPQPTEPTGPKVIELSHNEIKTTGNVNGALPIYDEDGVFIGYDEDYTHEHYKPADSTSVLDETATPAHRLIHTQNAKKKILQVRYDLLQDPNIKVEGLNTEGTKVEFQILENDYWLGHKDFVNESEQWKEIPIAVVYNGKIIEILSASDSIDRKSIYDALKDGKKVEGVVTNKNFGFPSNMLVDINQGKTDDNNNKLPKKLVKHFTSFRKARKRWHNVDGKFVMKESDNPIIIITGLETPDENQRIVESTHPKDSATGEYINNLTVTATPDNDDKGHVYMVTTGNSGEARAVKLSTATLSTAAVDKIIDLLKQKNGIHASELVATNENIPFVFLMGEDEAKHAQDVRAASDKFIQIDNDYTVYYSTEKYTDGTDIGFLKVQNEKIGSRDKTHFATKVEVIIKIKDGKRFFEIKPKTKDGIKETISLDRFNVEKDLHKFLSDKKYNVDLDLLRTNGPYRSKLTGKDYSSYRDYLDSTAEEVVRKGASGRPSILAMDTRDDNGTLFNNTQLTFGKLIFDNVVQPKPEGKVEIIPVAEIITKPAPVVPSNNPQEQVTPAPDVTGRTMGVKKNRFAKFSNKSENNGVRENILGNFVDDLMKNNEEKAIVDAYNKANSDGLSEFAYLKDVIDDLRFEIMKLNSYESINEVPDDLTIAAINQYRKCRT